MDNYVKVVVEGPPQVIDPETGLPSTVEVMQAAGEEAVKANEKAEKTAAKAGKAE